MALSDTPAWVRFIDLVRNSSNALRYLFINDQGMALADPEALTWTAIPVILQSEIPNRTTIHGQCLMYGFNLTDFGAVDDEFEVEIDGTNTFQWRKNAGSWTTGVSIGPEVALGANGLKVGFLDTTGYTTGDSWKWKRYEWSDTVLGMDTNKHVPVTSVYETDLYVSTRNRNIFRIRDEIVNSVGYKKVFGHQAIVFANHLVILQFAEAAYAAGVPTDPWATVANQRSIAFMVAWSDLNNPDEFFATDLNEADEYPVPVTDFSDTRVDGLRAAGLLGDILILYTADSSYTMRYVGLPRVMQIDKTPWNGVGCRYASSLVITPKGHYFVGRNDIYFFDGVTEPQAIGEAVRAKFFDEAQNLSNLGENEREDWLYGYYDVGKEEVVWTYHYILATGTYQCRQVVYQERDKQWYFRNVPHVRCQGRLYGHRTRCVYGAFNRLLRDIDATVSAQVDATVQDSVTSLGALSYTQPYVTSHITKYGLSRTMKEGDGQYIDANLGTATHIEYAYKARDFVHQIESMSFIVSAFTWVVALVERVLTLPGITAKVWQHRLTFKGTKPIGARLDEWGDVGKTEGGEK